MQGVPLPSPPPTPRPTCHPTRRLYHFTLKLCLECALDRRAALRQRRDPGYAGRLRAGPARVIGGPEQHAYVVPPAACPHCHRANALVFDAPFIQCTGLLGGCGWTAAMLAEDANVIEAGRRKLRSDAIV
jgi:hypothetical protein